MPADGKPGSNLEMQTLHAAPPSIVNPPDAALGKSTPCFRPETLKKSPLRGREREDPNARRITVIRCPLRAIHFQGLFQNGNGSFGLSHSAKPDEPRTGQPARCGERLAFFEGRALYHRREAFRTAAHNSGNQRRVENTPFHLAQQNRSILSIQRLPKKKGANPPPGEKRKSPLHFAGLPLFFEALLLLSLLLISAIFASLALR